MLGGISNAVVMIVIPWLILERTGSPAAAGVAAALSALPGILLSPLVGVLVDRIGRKTVSVVADAASGLSVLMFPVLDQLGDDDAVLRHGIEGPAVAAEAALVGERAGDVGQLDLVWVWIERVHPPARDRLEVRAGARGTAPRLVRIGERAHRPRG